MSPAARSAAGGGPIHVEAGVADRGREVSALGEEAVAGVDRIGAAPQSRLYECAGVEVRVDVQAFVGAPGMERAAIVGRGDRHGREPERARRAEDPQRDLAPVRYEELPSFHSPASVSRASAERVRYGTASDVASATSPPTAAPPLCPGAHARLIRANA